MKENRYQLKLEHAKSTNFQTDPTYIWKYYKIYKSCWLNIKPHHSKTNLQNNKEIEVALNKISPPWVQTNSNWLPTCQNNSFLDTPFSLSEFTAALQLKENNFAPCIDGIDFEIIKNLPINYKLILIDIYNEMYQSNSYPNTWKTSFVHFIAKVDRKSFRPISLTSCLCKLFESLIKQRLQWWAETNNLIPPSQNGFRKGKSCADNLTFQTLQIDKAFIQKKSVLAALLDIRRAFDNVNVEILLSKLASLGCSKSLIQFIKFLTHERQRYTDILISQATQ